VERIVKTRKKGKQANTDEKVMQLTAARRPRLLGKFCLNDVGRFLQRILVSISLLGVGLDKPQVSFIVVFSVCP
jgi:hypothetical protein